MRYQQPYGVLDVNAGYVNGDPSIGRAGSIPPAAAFEQPMREIVACITGVGFTPSDTDLSQLWKGLQVAPWIQEYAVDTGSANIYSASINPTPAQLYNGMRVNILIGNTNTGASSLNINGLGAHNIKRGDGFTDLAANDLRQGQVAAFVFDGSFWQMVNYFGFTNNNTVVNSTTSIPYAQDSGAVNAIVAPFSPVITSLAAGMPFLVKVMNTNTGPVTIKCNALAAVQLVWPDQSQLDANQIVTGGLIFCVFDGTKMQLLCHINAGGPVSPPTPTTGVPGTIDIWPTETAPVGAYPCDGRSLDRAADSRLFSILGTIYGAVDPGHFNVPDFRGMFVRGWSSGTGNDPDAATRTNRGDGVAGDHVGTKQTDQFASHNHAFPSGGVSLDFGPERARPGSPSHPTGTYVIDPGLSPPNNAITWGPVDSMMVHIGATPAGGMDVGPITSGSMVKVNRLDGLTITGTISSTGGAETRPKNIGMMYIIWK